MMLLKMYSSAHQVREFCSVGDDSCLILWMLVLVLVLLSRSADKSVHMFDRRNLTSGGVGAPVHKLDGHKAAVLCVQWSPDRASVFGSAAEDGFLNIWDYEKVGKKNEHAGSKTANCPLGLFFQHAGHRDVVDFH